MAKNVFYIIAMAVICTCAACGGGDVDDDNITPNSNGSGNISSKHDYVEIGGLKWATMNVGATTVAGSPSTCYGDYFAWGETEPRYKSITISEEKSVTFGGWKSNHSEGYSLSDYPSYTGGTLDAEHDAATQNWGSAWRTPTDDDFLTLRKACGGSNGSSTLKNLSTSDPTGGIYWLSSSQTFLSEYKGVAGILFVCKTDTSKRVFFPAAGSCYNTKFDSSGLYGWYWSSSLMTGSTYGALYMSFDDVFIIPSQSTYRSSGLTIRPVAD